MAPLESALVKPYTRLGRDLHAMGAGSGQTGPAASGCLIKLIQAGPVAAAISQESNEAPDPAGGLLRMELQAPSRLKRA